MGTINSTTESSDLTILRTLAPGKVNFSLFIGAIAENGFHPLVSLIQPVSLYDELTLELNVTELNGDTVVCDGVRGVNLAKRALDLYREKSGWDGPPVR